MIDIRRCWDDPWLLDTPEKVEWANAVNRERDLQRFDWRLYDQCWYRPVEAE